VVRNVPLFVNIWTRLLLRSATTTLPLPSTATPVGPLNCPSALPRLPHVVRKVPHASVVVVVELVEVVVEDVLVINNVLVEVEVVELVVDEVDVEDVVLLEDVVVETGPVVVVGHTSVTKPPLSVVMAGSTQVFSTSFCGEPPSGQAPALAKTAPNLPCAVEMHDVSSARPFVAAFA
jgi:hypothetical protein